MTEVGPGLVSSPTPPPDFPPPLPTEGGGDVVPTGNQQVDYFGFGGNERFVFPDGATYIEFSRLNEGEKARFETRTQADYTIKRNTGDAKVSVDPGLMRHELIRSAAKGWNLVAQNQPVPFTGPNLDRWLSVADPTIVQKLYDSIAEANPWLQADVTSEDIRKEIARLEGELKAKLEEEQAKAFSGSR